MVEQWNHTPRVMGSIPIFGSKVKLNRKRIMARSVWKGGYVDPSVAKLVRLDDVIRYPLFPTRPAVGVTRSRATAIQNSRGSQQPRRLLIKSRGSLISAAFVGQIVEIHNGRGYGRKRIVDAMVGRRFGEFSGTRTFRARKKK